MPRAVTSGPAPLELLDSEQLAAYLGIPLQTVYTWRSRRTGPKGIKVGRHVRYRLSDVDAWLLENTDHRP